MRQKNHLWKGYDKSKHYFDSIFSNNKLYLFNQNINLTKKKKNKTFFIQNLIPTSNHIPLPHEGYC